MKNWVDVLAPGGRVERVAIPEAGLTFGTAVSAQVKLPAVSGIAPMHCSLRPAPEGCWVELLDEVAEPFNYQGRVVRAELIEWGQDFFLGSVRVSVVGRGLEQTQKQSRVLWFLGVSVPLLVYLAFFAPDQTAHSAVLDNEPPGLFGELPPCSESKAGAVGRGAVAEQIALAKHERGVFELKDSVEGVQLMREATVCYALGDNQGASDRAFDRAEAWIADLQFSYKRALLDLETGRREHAPDQVVDAVQRLQILLSRSATSAAPFKQWMTQQRLLALVAIEEARKAAEKK